MLLLNAGPAENRVPVADATIPFVPSPEKTLIARIRKLARSGKRAAVAKGIGDDCAVLRPKAGEELLVTTDFTLEGTHFRREWHPANSVGHRCLARGLSDIAAMGGEPTAAFLSLALPSDLPQKWVDDFFSGFLALAERFNVTLAGGDTSESQSGVLADVMVIGSVPRSKAVLRSTARPGDVIYVTGSLGSSAATLKSLLSNGKVANAKAARPHFYPEPRVAIGKYLRERRLAASMIDISDGLSTDLAHICDESGVGAVLNQNLIPIGAGANLELALHGGEDYELLFTARKSARVPVEIAGVSITEIGWITREKKILITDCEHPPKRLAVRGWEHFKFSARNPSDNQGLPLR